MNEINIEAKIENLDRVNSFLHDCIDVLGCSMRTVMQLEIAVEELFSNICFYAYGEEGGTVCVQIDVDGTFVSITFIDGGRPYDPLKKEDPDITLGVEERPIGGLGIYMVKESMDNIVYEYKNEKNILTISKKII